MLLRTITAAIAVLFASPHLHASTGEDAKHALSSIPRVEIEGRWTLEEKSGGELQMMLVYGESNRWGRTIGRDELEGLSDAQIRASAATPVRFRIRREAGVLEMEGTFRGGDGSGRFRFQADRQFAATLRRLDIGGSESIRERELLALAIAGARADDIRELTRLVGRMDVDDLLAISIHGVTPRYVRELRDLEVIDDASASELVGMRIHGVTAEFVRELRSLGYRGLSGNELVGMRIHGVTAARIRELRALGYDDLTSSQLVAMRIHGVTPAFIREVRAAGYGDASADDLVGMRIRGIGTERRRCAGP